MGERIVITGTGGSGKSWLAAKLSGQLQVPAIHLDDVYWAGAYGGKGRDKQQVAADVRKLSEGENWIIEGIYGWLLPAALERATGFIFLDLPIETCLENLMLRGVQGGGTQASFAGMLAWVAEYPNRTDWYSHAAHQKLWDGFDGNKLILRSRSDIDQYVRRTTAAHQ